MIWKRALLLLVVAAVVIVAIVVALNYSNLGKQGFPGTSIRYDEPRLQFAATNGKPTLIYFSTVDCPACLIEDRVMDALFLDYNSTVNFIFMKYASSNGKLFQDWSVFVVPTLVLADEDGIIVKRYDGYVGEDDLRTDLQRLL